MKLVDKNILLISPEPWNHIFVSKHHYARKLAERSNQVIFANPAGKKWQLQNSEFPNLRELDYPKFIKGLRVLPSAISRRLILKRFDQIQDYCKIKFDIIWSFDNSVFFDFTFLPTFNVSHIVDLNQDFEMKRAAKTANICFYTTEYIGERLKKYNSNSYFINHGYNDCKPSESIELPGSSEYKVMYAGNLNMSFIDWESIFSAVEKNQNADFVFIGPKSDRELKNNPTWKFYELVELNPRSYFLGKVESDSLSTYYNSADLLIICYQESHHKDQANPHKMMEYLGSGKPIVATYTSVYKKYESPIIEMSRSNQDFGKKIENVLMNMDVYNRGTAQGQRRQIALENSYPKQIERIESLIGQDV